MLGDQKMKPLTFDGGKGTVELGDERVLHLVCRRGTVSEAADVHAAMAKINEPADVNRHIEHSIGNTQGQVRPREHSWSCAGRCGRASKFGRPWLQITAALSITHRRGMAAATAEQSSGSPCHCHHGWQGRVSQILKTPRTHYSRCCTCQRIRFKAHWPAWGSDARAAVAPLRPMYRYDPSLRSASVRCTALERGECLMVW
jgi:hypothetical protein